MVRIRLKRMGRRNRPFYRVGIFDAHEERDGKVIEEVGHYDPLEKDDSKREVLKKRQTDREVRRTLKSQ